jgi:hypothetical protein
MNCSEKLMQEKMSIVNVLLRQPVSSDCMANGKAMQSALIGRHTIIEKQRWAMLDQHFIIAALVSLETPGESPIFHHVNDFALRLLPSLSCPRRVARHLAIGHFRS